MTAAEFLTWLASSAADRRPLLMGILNVTPDSFSDGGNYLLPDAAVSRAIDMQFAGADLIDIGGESTRPGALPVSPDEQCDRVIPALRQIRARSDIAISIDTTSSIVADAAMAAGATFVNDVSGGLDDPEMLGAAGRGDWPIVLMHRPAPSAVMQQAAHYADVVREVVEFLRERRDAALAAGIKGGQIILDPGIGFGKTVEHDLTLLAELGQIRAIGHPILVGVSRKKFIGRLIGKDEPRDRLFGTAAAVAISIANGADIVRVHDVAEMRDVVSVACPIAARAREKLSVKKESIQA